MNLMTMYLMLIGAHSLGDYALQSNWIAVEKGKSLYILYIHAMIWTTVVCLVSYVIGFQLGWVKILFILLVPHFIMDYFKAQSKWYPKLIGNEKVELAIDQCFHYVQLLIWLLVR